MQHLQNVLSLPQMWDGSGPDQPPHPPPSPLYHHRCHSHISRQLCMARYQRASICHIYLKSMMHLSLYFLSLGVQLTLKHVEAVVVLQVLCLRVTEHNDATWQAGISAMHLLLTACISA